MTHSTTQIADLLVQTRIAHHAAYHETDGDDPEWPLWYAAFLQEKIIPIIRRKLTQSELVYWLVDSDRRFQSGNATGPWQQFYAQALLNSIADDQ